MALLTRRTLAWLAAIAVTAATESAAQLGPRAEHEIKAAFLLNFMKFVEWPPERTRDSPLTICVSGDGPIRDALEAIVRGQHVGDQHIVVRRLGDGDDPRTCHSLFISAQDGPVADLLLEQVHGADVLTVGETPHFITDGGLIRFYVFENRVRFQIDGPGASLAGLRINAQLLSLAR